MLPGDPHGSAANGAAAWWPLRHSGPSTTLSAGDQPNNRLARAGRKFLAPEISSSANEKRMLQEGLLIALDRQRAAARRTVVGANNRPLQITQRHSLRANRAASVQKPARQKRLINSGRSADRAWAPASRWHQWRTAQERRSSCSSPSLIHA